MRTKTTTLKNDIESLTDQEALTVFFTLMNRIDVGTGFLQANEEGLITHQVMTIKCGDEEITSAPLSMDTPLMLATVENLGGTVN